MDKLGKVLAVFRELGLKPGVNDFESKLVMQKTICLLQLMGVKCGFSFNIYVRGAYSPDLTIALYSKASSAKGLASSEKLSSKELGIVSEFKEIMHDMDPVLLEIAATYAFLVKERHMSVPDAMKAVKQAKPFYSEVQFAVGFSRAKQLVSTVTPEDLRKMKEEFALWERASDEDMQKWL